MEEKKIDLDTDLRELAFSVRTLHGIGYYLDTVKVLKVRYLCMLTERDLIIVKNFGKRSLNEVLDVLGEYGLWLGMTEEQLAEYEGKPLKKDEPAEETEELAEDNINWEERRWGLVAMNMPDSLDKIEILYWKMNEVLKLVDLWIKLYKVRLKKERRHNT